MGPDQRAHVDEPKSLEAEPALGSASSILKGVRKLKPLVL